VRTDRRPALLTALVASPTVWNDFSAYGALASRSRGHARISPRAATGARRAAPGLGGVLAVTAT
jgi:hypothetical protein